MKAYEEVVRERYDGREVEYSLYENPYSLVNPVGFYGSMRIREAFFNVLKGLRESGIDLSQEKILDVGCGKGDHTRYFADLFHNPQQIYGMDLSTHRVSQAKQLNPTINYLVDDIVKPQNIPEKEFGLITAVDVFMHLEKREQITQALLNIQSLLKEGGIFIWYDAVVKDHFASDLNAECNGFHPKQMLQFCDEAGFKRLFSLPIFKNVMWKYHSVYLTRKFPMWLVSLAESVLPGSPGNVMMVFQKSSGPVH
jgi:SAM-dependent methyltransferase